MNFCEIGLFCETQDDFVFVVSKYNFYIYQTKETGKNKEAPVLLLLTGRKERELLLNPIYPCAAFSAAATRYSEGVWPVRRLNTLVK